jgi:hypothetical protein
MEQRNMGLTYSEDFDAGFDVSDSDIAECQDRDTLLEWLLEVDATIADINGQVEVCALGGCADLVWVHKAAKASGFYRKARSRIEHRLEQIGYIFPQKRGDVADLNRKLVEAKARSAVAVEFYRLCSAGGMQDRDLFASLDARAVAAIDHRNAKRSAA